MQKKISGIIFTALLTLCALFIGYLAGFSGRPAETTVTVVQQGENKVIEVPTRERPENGILDLNSATQEDLMQLPGIGEELASRIIEYRKNIGNFVSAEQLMDVEGIGEKRYEKLKDRVTVGETP